MKVTDFTSGTCRPSGFAEYDSLTGYITRTYTTEWLDDDGVWWRKTCQVINLGKPDRGTPVDPDAAIAVEPEPWEPESPAMPKAAWAGTKRAKAERDAVLLEQVADHLAAHGPMPAIRITQALGIGDRTRVITLLRQHPDRFTFHGGQFSTWSLLGQEYKPKKHKLVSKTMIAIREAIETHGPQSARELAKRLRLHQSSVHNSLIGHPDWFRVVEMRARVGHVPAARVWGLRERQFPPDGSGQA